MRACACFVALFSSHFFLMCGVHPVVPLTLQWSVGGRMPSGSGPGTSTSKVILQYFPVNIFGNIFVNIFFQAPTK